MSAKEELERIIDEQIEENEKLISILEAATKPIAPDNAIGRLTRMEALGAKSINEEALRMAQDRIIKLDSARIGSAIQILESAPDVVNPSTSRGYWSCRKAAFAYLAKQNNM